jgi:hypothetical protein
VKTGPLNRPKRVALIILDTDHIPTLRIQGRFHSQIKENRRVRAGDLAAHKLNFRWHPEFQRAALAARYREVGFARSLQAIELREGP